MEHKHDCQKMLQNISDFIDGELSPDICEEIERHLEECPDCRVVLNTTKKTIELYHNDPIEASLPTVVRQRLFIRLNLDEFSK